MYAPLLDVEASFCVAGARDCAPCQKWAKREGFCSISKNDGRRGTFEEDHDLQRCIFRGRRSTRDMIIRAVRRSERWFLEKGLEHQIFSFAEMILRARCSTSYDLASLFSWQAQYFRQVEWKNRKTHWYESVSSALNFPFLKEVSQNELFGFLCCQLRSLRKSRRLVSFLMSSSKVEDVSQTCFVFDVVKLKHWGRLAK